MTVSKSILTVSTLAFALMFGGGVYVLTHLDSLAKPLTERVASEALGVPVRIADMNVSLPEKTVFVSGVRIANPPGFSKPYAMTIDSVGVALNDVKQGLIDFKGINVKGANVFLEVKDSTTNLQVLQRGMKGDSGQSDDAQSEKLKVIIRRFALDGAQLNPSVTLMSAQDLAPVQVAPIVLTDIGVKENGVLARDGVAQVMAPLLKNFTRRAGRAGFYEGLSPEALKELGISQIERIRDQIVNEVDKIGSDIKELIE